MWQVALRYLTYRLYSEKELRQKLEKFKFPPAHIEAAMEKLKTYKYINDEELSRMMANKYFFTGQLGFIGMINKFNQRGLSGVDIEWFLASYDEAVEFKLAVKIVDRRFNLPADDYATKGKIYRLLVRKGYSAAVVNRVINKMG